MGEPQRSALFPVEHKRGDKRFEGLGRDVARVIEQRCYGRLEFEDRDRLEKALFELIYGSRGAAGELEKRLNGTAAPLVDDEGGLDSYECAAVAHEIRRKRGADGAIVIALKERPDGKVDVHFGMATPKEKASQTDLVAAKLVRQFDEAEAAGGHLQDLVLTVDDDGSGSVS